MRGICGIFIPESEPCNVRAAQGAWGWLNGSRNTLEEINPDGIRPRDNKGNKVLCEGELRALESQNSIPSKSRVNLGLPNAVTQSPSPGLRVRGSLPLLRVGPEAPRAQMRHFLFRGIPSLSAVPEPQSPREGANSFSASSLPGAAPFGNNHASFPPEKAALELLGWQEGTAQVPRVALGSPPVLAMLDLSRLPNPL